MVNILKGSAFSDEYTCTLKEFVKDSFCKGNTTSNSDNNTS